MPAKIKFILIILLIFSNSGLRSQIHAQTYYISPSGNDNNDGHASNRAWRSLDRIKKAGLKQGSRILLEGGKIFKGSIRIDQVDDAASKNPITFSSYGKGYAIIDAGDSAGLVGMNCSNVTVSNIHFRGNGVGENTNPGIFFYSDLQLYQPENITIKSCVVEGFGTYGILFGSAEGAQAKGYNSVKISHCIATRNGEAGIGSYGDQNHFPHTNFLVTHCKAFSNRGILTKTQNHSGNGIVFGSVENITIEYCAAFENGADNRCNAGGPVGIWVWLCKNAVIQYCESHHNHAGAGKDGGGFDIDGGSSNCVIQFNYSHDNEGAGYLLAEYGANLPFVNDTIRFNISQNDGRKNNYGAITIWGASNQYQVKNSIVYNNTIYVSDEQLVNGTPCAIQLMGPNLSGVILANNIFLTKGKAEFVNSSDPVDALKVKFISNNYFSYTGGPVFNWNQNIYRSLADWKSKAYDQEIFDDRRTGIYKNPQLLNPGSGSILKSWDSVQIKLKGYFPQKSSPIRYTGVSLNELGIRGKGKDFFGARIDNNSRITPGVAH